MSDEIQEIPISWDRLLWCNVHQHRIHRAYKRGGIIHYECGPRRGGITFPCICTDLTGLVEITDDCGIDDTDKEYRE